MRPVCLWMRSVWEEWICSRRSSTYWTPSAQRWPFSHVWSLWAWLNFITNAGEGSGPDIIQGLYESSGLSVSKSDAWRCNVMKIMYKKYMKCEKLQVVLQFSPVVCGEDVSCVPFVFILWHYCDVEVGLVACLWKSTKRTGTNGA